MPTTTATDNTRPPRKRQAKILDYDVNPSTGFPTTVSNSNSSICTSLPPGNLTAATVEFMTELASLKTELQSLRMLITTAVAQLKTEIASLHANPMSSDMETEAEKTEVDNSLATTLDISNLIANLKNDIAIIISHPLFSRNTKVQPSNLNPNLNQCGSS